MSELLPNVHIHVCTLYFTQQQAREQKQKFEEGKFMNLHYMY